VSSRVAVYARQSVKADEGIDLQIRACRDEAQRRDWTVAEVYADNATSASRDRGPSSNWSRMLSDIDAGLIDTVLVVAPDRLTRRVVDILEVTAPKRDVRLVSVRGGLDTENQFGKFTLTLLTALAEQEIETKEARNVPGRIERRAAGHPNAGRVPYGYKWVQRMDRDERGTRYVVSEAEAQHVRWMFSEALAGVPLGAIARNLNEREVPSNSGGKWHSTTIRRMLLSPTYAALLVPKATGHYRAEDVDMDACTPGAWEAIVSLDTVLAARALLINPARTTNGGDTSSKHLLSGIAVCDVCRQPVRSAVSKEKFRAYRCPAGHFHRRAEFVERVVEAVVVARLSQPDAADLVEPQPGVDTEALRARRTVLIAKSEQLLQWFMEDRFPAAQIETQKAAVDEELASIAAQLSAAVRRNPFEAIVAVDDVQEAWDALSLARKRIVLRALLTPVIRQVGKGVRATDLDTHGHTVGIEWRGTTGLL
jgi:site-specific DNA recombinase